MPSLIGSSPACRRRHPFRTGWLALAVLLGGTGGIAAMPDYVRTALANFSTEVPAGWAYTLTTVRNAEARTTARFDPARPPAEQWTLVDLNGHAPSAREAAQFARARAGSGPATTQQGTFRKGDIEPASVTLIKEDAERGEFTCTFREEATGADKMLGHLTLRLTVNKRQPHVEKFVLELKEPYNPVLGVKMRELVVQMNFTPPTGERPSLPNSNHSHFVGRIFFIGVEEDLVLTYSNFVPSP
jgi:hypothetical protein